MRIISQDGMIDVPYEQSIISIDYRNKTNIISRGSNCCEHRPYLMAKYSTEAKAQKAMEMLREAYCGIVKVSKEITDMEIKKIAEDIRNGFVQPIPMQEPKVECKYFQFPSDEELEG